MKINAFCPECDYEVDAASGVGDAEGQHPEPGNIAVCIRCAAMGIYFEQPDGTLGLRAPTTEEYVELSEDEEIIRVRASIIGFKVWRKQ